MSKLVIDFSSLHNLEDKISNLQSSIIASASNLRNTAYSIEWQGLDADAFKNMISAITSSEPTEVSSLINLKNTLTIYHDLFAKMVKEFEDAQKDCENKANELKM